MSPKLASTMTVKPEDTFSFTVWAFGKKNTDCRSIRIKDTHALPSEEQKRANQPIRRRPVRPSSGDNFKSNQSDNCLSVQARHRTSNQSNQDSASAPTQEFRILNWPIEFHLLRLGLSGAEKTTKFTFDMGQ